MSAAPELPPFPGFRPQAFSFLTALKKNNDREWFAERKAVYEDELLWPARCLVAQVSAEGPGNGVPLTGSPTKSVFRIYRDVRFSKNKDPYKTHVGVVLTRGGAKNEPGGLYIHIEPGGCFVAAGFWQPDPKTMLPQWRDRMAHAHDQWLDMVRTVEAEGLAFEAGPTGSLKRMPRGYESEADSEVAQYLKWKGAIASRPIPDADVSDPQFAETVLEIGRAAMPLLNWGWELKAG